MAGEVEIDGATAEEDGYVDRSRNTTMAKILSTSGYKISECGGAESEF